MLLISIGSACVEALPGDTVLVSPVGGVVVLRAVAFREGFLPARVVTHSWIFIEMFSPSRRSRRAFSPTGTATPPTRPWTFAWSTTPPTVIASGRTQFDSDAIDRHPREQSLSSRHRNLRQPVAARCRVGEVGFGGAHPSGRSPRVSYRLRHDGVTAVDGDARSWHAMRALAARDLAGVENYTALRDFLDVPDLVDYIRVNFFAGNQDWPHRNWYATRARLPEAGFRFHGREGRTPATMTGWRSSPGSSTTSRVARQPCSISFALADSGLRSARRFLAAVVVGSCRVSP